MGLKPGEEEEEEDRYVYATIEELKNMARNKNYGRRGSHICRVQKHSSFRMLFHGDFLDKSYENCCLMRAAATFAR